MKTVALIVVFREPVDADVAEAMLADLEGVQLVGESIRDWPPFHVEHFTARRAGQLTADLLRRADEVQ